MDATTIDTPRGPVEARTAFPPDAGAGALMVGGVGGGFDTPARDLYPHLADALVDAGSAAVHLRYRNPRDLLEAVADVEAALDLLRDHGVARIALLGHSFGGAVVIAAAARAPDVAAVVTLSTQSYGTSAVGDLTVPLLAVHGTADPVLPARCSQDVVARAGGPSDLVLLEGVGHDLIADSDTVHTTVRTWVLRQLRSEHDAA